MTAKAYQVLLVCAGNTCRSAMAAAIMQSAIPLELRDRIEISSAGTATFEGAPASAGAMRAVRAHGLTLEHHRSRRLTAELLAPVDLVLAMEPAHLDAILSLHPPIAAHAFLLTAFASDQSPRGGRPIPDPFGGDEAGYDRTFEELRVAVEAAVERTLEQFPEAEGPGTEAS